MKAEKTVYKVSRSYKRFARKLAERKNEMDRAQLIYDTREAALAEADQLGKEKLHQYIISLQKQGLSSDEIIKRL